MRIDLKALNFGNCVIILVAGLSCLEEDIVVLSSTSCYRMLRVKSTTAESLNCIPIKHIAEVCVIPLLNLLNFVRSSETVKEMKERNSALNSCKVSNSGKVHTFLRIV